ncbi:endonuclease VII domain-containing protein [Streptomyces sp. NPDC056069]|uniref:endonuclease VII domain-containing protein n=1 Tax=Streptomyces sp. NPDC056069 TaxID=3345702 RepID=UPI0035DE2F99
MTTETGQRRWIPGHKRLFTPLGEVRGKQPVPGGWSVSCKCGWSASSPSPTTAEAERVYRQHFDEVANELERLHIPHQRRSITKISGHKREVSPRGPSTRGKPVSEGWVSACACGWTHELPLRTFRAAENAYADHVDTLAEENWPVCKRCTQRKRPSQMSTSSPRMCKPCRTAATRAWAAANPSEWERHRRRSYLKRRYGITLEEADALLADQNGKCAICGAAEGDSRGFRMHIDHDHSTGAVRGVLCNLCNAGLGNFRDKPELLLKAITYLELHTRGEDRHAGTDDQAAFC